MNPTIIAPQEFLADYFSKLFNGGTPFADDADLLEALTVDQLRVLQGKLDRLHNQ